jgi:hypothetical protein
MPRTRPRSILGLVAVLATLFLVIPGVATAGSAGTHHAAKASTQHILALSNNPSNNAKAIVIAQGPVHARGVDIVTGRHTDLFKFPNGALKIFHKAKGQHSTFDKKTCLGLVTEHGIFKVTGGTGAYAGASGHGTYHLTVTIVACRNQKPKVFQLQIHAAGPLSM